ncbi:MAG: amidohydrolase family protein, partial [Acidithiobacillus ferrooxidans]
TDGAASNNDLDMLGELRTAALLAKGVSGDPTVFPAWEALEAATLGGAEAIGWGAETGSLEPGKAADCIAIDLDHPATYPVYDPVSQVVYCAGRDQVSHVWVNGNPRVVEGRAVDWDTQELFARVRGWVERIREKDKDR